MSKISKKKKFEKPEVKKVPLAIEEAVLAGCKTGSGNSNGPGFAKCFENLGMNQKAPCSAYAS